jgi:hypothetical protein
LALKQNFGVLLTQISVVRAEKDAGQRRIGRPVEAGQLKPAS